MRILGLSFFYHDAAACLLEDGVPVAMAEEERFSRKKHDSGFPSRAIDFVLRAGGVDAEALDAVVFYEKPFLKLDRIIKTALTSFPWAPRAFAESMKHLFVHKLWIRDLIARTVGIDPAKVFFSAHHLSHAASAFFASPFDKAAVLTIDGVGEWATASIGIGNGATLKIIKEIHFPHSLGLLYSAFTAFLGFEVNDGEYKVMGMAPYGTPRYAETVKKIVTAHPDGSFRLHLPFFSFHRSLTRTFSRKFVSLFGAPRDPGAHFFTRTTGWPSYFGEKPSGAEYDRLAVAQEHYADIAASIQAVLEEQVLSLAREAHRLTGMNRLCYAGGVALNSVANWKIREATPFTEIYIQPAAGDSGGALGAALALYHQGFEKPRSLGAMAHASYGASYGHERILQAIKGHGLAFVRIEDQDALLDRAVDALVAGQVIGWFHGRFEWGPRALGNRSILADPRRADMKDIVNTKIKFREPYRPFAPSVLAEYAEEYFAMPHANAQWPARFMLYVVPVRTEKRGNVPAITHVDGTARPQLVFHDANPRYWELISRFFQKTGVPMVLNTSFNVKGEPIVNSPEDAIATFLKSGMDMLVLEDYLVFRPEEPQSAL